MRRGLSHLDVCLPSAKQTVSFVCFASLVADIHMSLADRMCLEPFPLWVPWKECMKTHLSRLRLQQLAPGEEGGRRWRFCCCRGLNFGPGNAGVRGNAFPVFWGTCCSWLVKGKSSSSSCWGCHRLAKENQRERGTPQDG